MSQSIAPVLEEKQTDTSPTLTFEEYRVYEGEIDVQYELYKGKLIPMPIDLDVSQSSSSKSRRK